jgi:CHAT domain-containing protein/Tfp pilus assembly protein PilF
MMAELFLLPSGKHNRVLADYTHNLMLPLFAVWCWLALGLGLAQTSPPPDPALAALADRLFLEKDAVARIAMLEQSGPVVSPALVKAMNEMAGQVFDRRDYSKALAMYQTACDAAVKAGDRRGQAVCLYDQGLCEMRLMRGEQARPHFEQAIVLYQQAGDLNGVSSALNGIANLVRTNGDYRGSIPYYERALSLGDGINEVSVAQTNSNLAISLLRMGNYKGAIDHLLKSLAITRRRRMERESALVLNNLGSAYFDQGDMELARTYAEQALAIKEKAGDPGELATTVMNLGVLEQAAGRASRARELFERALKLTEEPSLLPIRLRLLFNYGNLLFRENDETRAKEMLESTVALAEKNGGAPEAANARVVLAQLAVGQHRFDDALELGRSAAEYGRWSGQADVLAQALDVAGVALHELKRPDKAQAAFEEAIQEIEGLRAQLPGEQQGAAHFLENWRGVFLHMVELQLDRKRNEAALSYVERSKARSLLDTLKLGNPAITKTMTAEEGEHERALARNVEQLRDAVLRQSRRPNTDRKRLDEIVAQLAEARAEYRSFEAALYVEHPRLKVARAAFDPVRPIDLLHEVEGDNTAMVEYSIGDGGITLFVLTRTGAPVGPDLRVYHIAKSVEALKRDVARFRQQIATRDLGWRDLAATLYRDLLGPAAAQLKGSDTLVISPDGFLWDLPFQALAEGPSRLLIEDHPLFYTPSLTFLAEMRKLHETSNRDGKLLAINALALPSAAREVAGMRQVYGAPRVAVLEGAEANSDAVRRESSKFDVLHLAAHGVFDNQNPLNSYLLLSKDGKPETGVMEARDWMDLSLHASVVVLSGCETARGQATGGEGLLGMSWALFIAGSPATVASQWKVESDATSRLMLAFHRHAQQTPKAAALRAAELEVLKNPAWRHPFYWSSFVLIGDGL